MWLKKIISDTDMNYSSLPFLVVLDDSNNAILTMFEDAIEEELNTYNKNEIMAPSAL